MAHHFTRQALYELVWSEPMQHLAKKFSISDRGLAKICAHACCRSRSVDQSRAVLLAEH